jgi:membrane-associated phospholipid phosphatase
VVEQTGGWIDTRAARVGGVLALLGAVLGLLARRYDSFLGDEWVAARLRSLGAAFEPVADVFNEGDRFIAAAVLGGLVAGLVARRRVHLALLVALAVVVRPLLTAVKQLVDRPRPSGAFEPLDVVTNSSFPSGHTMTSALLFGLLFVLAAEVVPRRWVWPVRVVAVAAVGLTAASRIWAGVHWPSDTYGALVWSGALMALVLALRPAASRFCGWSERWWIARVRRQPSETTVGR